MLQFKLMLITGCSNVDDGAQGLGVFIVEVAFYKVLDFVPLIHAVIFQLPLKSIKKLKVGGFVRGCGGLKSFNPVFVFIYQVDKFSSNKYSSLFANFGAGL